MILLKNDTNSKKNALLVEFYMLLIALILACLVNPIKLADLDEASSWLTVNDELNGTIMKSKIRLKRLRNDSFLINNADQRHLKSQTTKENTQRIEPANSDFTTSTYEENLLLTGFNFTVSNVSKANESLSFTGIDYIGYYSSRNDNTSGMNMYGVGEDEYAATVGELRTKRYWALVLIFIPLCTIIGNILVVVSVVKEKNLHTVTNYFVVSLAIADLTVASTVMPFAVYYEVLFQMKLILSFLK